MKTRTFPLVVLAAIASLLLIGCSEPMSWNGTDGPGFGVDGGTNPGGGSGPLFGNPVPIEGEPEATSAPDPGTASVDDPDPSDDQPPAEEVGEEVAITALSCRDNDDPLCDDPRIEWPENLTVVTWSIKNVQAAFMRILPYPDEQDLFAYTAFIGDVHSPYVGAVSNVDDDFFTFVEDLLDAPLSGFGGLSADIKQSISEDDNALPFSYCSTNPSDSDASCFADGHDPLNYLHVFFPLRKDETSRSGKWLMSIDQYEHGFAVYYRDILGNGIHSKAVINTFIPAS